MLMRELSCVGDCGAGAGAAGACWITTGAATTTGACAPATCAAGDKDSSLTFGNGVGGVVTALERADCAAIRFDGVEMRLSPGTGDPGFPNRIRTTPLPPSMTR